MRCFLISAAQGVSGRPSLRLVPISQNAATGGELGSGRGLLSGLSGRRAAGRRDHLVLPVDRRQRARQARPARDPDRFSARCRRGRACRRPLEAAARRAVGVPARPAGRQLLHAWATAPRRTPEHTTAMAIALRIFCICTSRLDENPATFVHMSIGCELSSRQVYFRRGPWRQGLAVSELHRRFSTKACGASSVRRATTRICPAGSLSDKARALAAVTTPTIPVSSRRDFP